MITNNLNTLTDISTLFCDQLLGQGMSRTVWSSLLLPDCVIKLEERAGFFQNIIEWETWQRVKYTEYSKYFAICHFISPNGVVLVQERTIPPRPEELPNYMPNFLCDLKIDNFGFSSHKDRKLDKDHKSVLVCHDYGTNLLFEHGMSRKMRKADWV